MFNMMFLVMFLPSVMGFVPRLGQGVNFGGWCKTCFFRVTICTRFTFESACLEKYFYESQPILYLYFKRSPCRSRACQPQADDSRRPD